MLQLKTDHTFRNRFLFVFLFMTMLHGLTAYAGYNRLNEGSLKAGNHQWNVSLKVQAGNRHQGQSFQTQKGHRHQELSFRPSTTHRSHVDLHPSHFFLQLPLSLMEDIPEDLTEDQFAFFARAHEPRHKRRYYISVNSQQYSFTTRLQQLQLLLVQYIPGNENKTGIYQWHDAFLPAYYKFLFRYTLF